MLFFPTVLQNKDAKIGQRKKNFWKLVPNYSRTKKNTRTTLKQLFSVACESLCTGMVLWSIISLFFVVMLFDQTSFFCGIPFFSIPFQNLVWPIQRYTESTKRVLFLRKNCSKTIPQNFFWTEFRWHTYPLLYLP